VVYQSSPNLESLFKYDCLILLNFEQSFLRHKKAAPLGNSFLTYHPMTRVIG